eukprot:6283634-Amphidinium_carterae.1
MAHDAKSGALQVSHLWQMAPQGKHETGTLRQVHTESHSWRLAPSHSAVIESRQARGSCAIVKKKGVHKDIAHIINAHKGDNKSRSPRDSQREDQQVSC